MDDLALMELQAEALFVTDDRGRMLHTREPDARPAPRFFMGRTRAGNLWRCGHDLPDGVVGQLNALAAAEPTAIDLRAEAEQLPRIRERLRWETEIRETSTGPAYCFPAALPVSGKIVRFSDRAIELLPPEFAWVEREWEGLAPVVLSVAEGRAVSVCFCSRLTGRAAEAGVNTLEAFRGQGHASRAVAAWARAVRETSRVPLYSTSWENLASQGVARRLGLRMYGVDLSIT